MKRQPQYDELAQRAKRAATPEHLVVRCSARQGTMVGNLLGHYLVANVGGLFYAVWVGRDGNAEAQICCDEDEARDTIWRDTQSPLVSAAFSVGTSVLVLEES